MTAALVVLVWLLVGWLAWVVIGAMATATWLALALRRAVTTRPDCPHTRQRCIHGDEIITAGFRRARCLDCWALLGPLPATCTATGRPHPGSAS